MLLFYCYNDILLFGCDLMSSFLNYFFVFFIYSVVGWFAESVYASINERKIVNRGFLIGPYCPIYGCGSLIIILYLDQYKDNFITVFFLAVVLCSILEYFTSYLMEKLFKTRWWDYSEQKFNLNGRICGQFSILFGLGGLFVIYCIHPIFVKLYSMIPENIILVIVIISFIMFVVDTIISFNIVNRFKNTVSNIDLRKDSTQEFSKVVKDTLLRNHRIFQERLFSAFPDVDLKKFIRLRKRGIRRLLKK